MANKLVTLLILFVALMSPLARAQSAISQNFSFQGYLDGLADGTYDMKFLFQPSNNTVSVSSVPVSGGVFTATVPVGALGPTLFLQSSPTVNLLVDANHDSTYSLVFANLPIGSVPSAFVAETAIKAISIMVGTSPMLVPPGGSSNMGKFLQLGASGNSLQWTNVPSGVNSFGGDVSGTPSGSNVNLTVTGLQGSPVPPVANGYLRYNGGAFAWDTSPGSGTVTSVTAGAGPLTVANSTTAPVLSLAVGTAVGTVAAGNDTRIVNAIQGGGTPTSAGGSLSGTYPNPTIAAGAVTGSMIAAGTVTPSNISGGTTGTFLKSGTSSSTSWAPLNYSDLSGTVPAASLPSPLPAIDGNALTNLNPLNLSSLGLSGGGAYEWNGISSWVAAHPVNSGPGSNGPVNIDITGSNTFNVSQTSVSRIMVDASGKVGIGTPTPNTQLDVVGNTHIGGSLAIGSAAGAGISTMHIHTFTLSPGTSITGNSTTDFAVSPGTVTPTLTDLVTGDLISCNPNIPSIATGVMWTCYATGTNTFTVRLACVTVASCTVTPLTSWKLKVVK